VHIAHADDAQRRNNPANTANLELLANKLLMVNHLICLRHHCGICQA